MIHVRISLAGLLAVALMAAAAEAADLHLEFVQGLRAKEYYDTTIEYLDRIENEPGVPDDVRAVIPFERGLTLLASARHLSPEVRRESLEKARNQFQIFEERNPQHALAGRANSERANILLEEARVNIWKSQSPSHEGHEQPFRDEARKLIAEARDVFQKAHDQHKAAWESFPVHVDERLEPERHAARGEAELAYIRAQLNLAMCTYEEAQSWPPGAPDFSRLLTRAAEQFEEIHTRYRSMPPGLYARMWQAKCFQEQAGQEGLGRALGIYRELLDHPGNSPSMQRVQEHVRYFWAICQNLRGDHQLVIQAAEQWMKDNRHRLQTETGLGMRWEYVRALEARAQSRDIEPREKERTLRVALAEAQGISDFSGKFQDVANFAIPRLKQSLNIDLIDPQDFDTALGQARIMVKPGIGNRQLALEQERNGHNRRDEIAALEQDLNAQLAETARILRLALDLADSRTDPRQVVEAQYLLAYVDFLRGRTYEAGILGEFIGRRSAEIDNDYALRSAYIAMAAWIKSYSTSDQPEAERTFEIDQIARACELITSRWPQTDEAQGARLQLGRIFSRRGQPAEAARWFSQIPASSDDYAEAQLSAGQAYLAAYSLAGRDSDEEQSGGQPPPTEAERMAWLEEAEKHLLIGIARVEANTPQDNPAPPELVAAKVSLAEIQVNRNRFDDAVKTIQAQPHAPLDAIQVKPGTKRAEQGVQSAAFASQVYRILLRSYVGTRNIDEALNVMDELEQTVPEGDDGTQLTAIYIGLGQKLKEEIERLRAGSDGNRLTEVLTSFDEFLSALSSQKDKMTYGALIWIAETYFYLAEGMAAGDARAVDYYTKAAQTYQEILSRPDFIPGGKDVGVKLRLVNCLGRQGEFRKALDMVGELLARNALILPAQFEAAEVLQEWGDSGQPDAHEHYLEAIRGRNVGRKQNVIWGWVGIARKLTGQPDFHNEQMQARFNSAECRQKYARQLSARKDREKELKLAKSEIETFARATGPEQLGHEWWGRFESLYKEIQVNLNSVEDLFHPRIEPLPRPTQYAVRAAPTGVAVAAASPRPSEQGVQPKSSVSKPPEKSTNPLIVVLGVLLALGAAGGVVYGMTQSQKRSRPRMAYASVAPAFPAAGGRRSSEVKRAARSQAERQQSRASESTGSDQPASPSARSGSGRPSKRTSGEQPPSST